MILDFHAHIFPEHLSRKAMITMGERSLLPFYTDGTAPQLKASMRDAGVTHSVICNIATKPGQTANILAFAESILRENPPGTPERLIPFASVHPLEDGAIDWLPKIKEMGFLGLKLHPDYQRFYINDPALEQFYREAIRLGLILLFHAGLDAGFPDPIHATPERILDILPVLERGTTILAHCGGYEMQDKVLIMLAGRNVYFDTAYNLDKIPLETFRALIRKHTPDRFLFATDTPWCSQKDFVRYWQEQVQPGFLNDVDNEKILWRNGANLLGLI